MVKAHQELQAANKYASRNRHSIRLHGYDYSYPGAYFLTIVTRERENLFGEIDDGEISLHETGQIVWDAWNSLPNRYSQISMRPAIVMPNHFHGIIIINDDPDVGVIHDLPLHPDETFNDPSLSPEMVQRRRMTLPLVVGYFKMNSAKRINAILESPGIPVWQRNYYEHIIRDEEEFERITNYIETNVENWYDDDENPSKSNL